MAESKVKRENYLVIQGFMLTDLKLKGNELLVYACIYGFSQAECQAFSGSLQYLADWTNSTKQSVIKCLKSLVEKGLLVKKDNIINGVKFCEYYTTELNTLLNKVEYPIKQSLTGGMQQSLPNIIDINNIENNLVNKKVSKSNFDSIIYNYAKGNEEIIDLLREWLKVRKVKRAAMTDRAIQMNIDKLDDLAAKSGMSVTNYLKEIICKGWAAFYVINNYSGFKAEQPAKPKTQEEEARQQQLESFLKANEQQAAEEIDFKSLGLF